MIARRDENSARDADADGSWPRAPPRVPRACSSHRICVAGGSCDLARVATGDSVLLTALVVCNHASMPFFFQVINCQNNTIKNTKNKDYNQVHHYCRTWLGAPAVEWLVSAAAPFPRGASRMAPPAATSASMGAPQQAPPKAAADARSVATGAHQVPAATRMATDPPPWLPAGYNSSTHCLFLKF